MNLQHRRETIVVQDEVLLNTQGLIFKVGGITLDGAAFPEEIVKSGTAVMLDEATGLFVPYADGAEGAVGSTELYLTAQDAVNRNAAPIVIGAFVKAYVNTSKLTGVTDAFKAATANSRYIFG